MTGHESGIDLRRDDGTLDVSLNWIARNGEVHFTIEVNSQYGLSKTIVDFTAAWSKAIGGEFLEAGRQAGLAEVPPLPTSVPASVAEAQGTYPYPSGPPQKWTAQDVGHVLGERD